MKSLASLAACAAVLTGCLSSEPQSGGEDFPNTVSALGRVLAQGMDSSQAWNGLDSADASFSLSGPNDTVRLGARAGRQLVSSCRDTVVGDVLGAMHAYFTKTVCLGGEGYRRDSVAFGGYFPKMTEADIDTILWSEVDTIRPLIGYSRKEVVQDASGRGFFLLKSADTGRVRVGTQRRYGRWTEISDLVTGTGPDRRFSTSADNEFWSGSKGLLRGGDTLEWMDIRPWPASQPVIGSGDSGVALATKFAVLSGRRKTERGVLVAFRDSTSNYARRWQTRVDWEDGAFREESVIGPHPDSTFRPRDTVLVLQRSQVRGDSLHQEIRALIGPDPRNRKQDSLLSVRVVRFRSTGAERRTLWEFQSDRPVADGQEPTSGSIRARIDFADGAFLEFSGTWNATEFTGVWTNGKRQEPIRFDRRGGVR